MCTLVLAKSFALFLVKKFAPQFLPSWIALSSHFPLPNTLHLSKQFAFFSLERFCIPFYGIFKTESLSDRVRVRSAASRRLLSTKTVLHFVRRFGGFVWRFRGSGRAIVLSRSRWISSLFIFWPRTKTEIWTKKNFLFFSRCSGRRCSQSLCPNFSLPWSAGWRGLCSTCSTARLSQIASCSSFLSFCAVR